jgi:shikimate dehydrogenase
VVWEAEYRISEGTGLVVNATSIGLFRDSSARLALELRTLTPDMLVCDVIPSPPRPRLREETQARICTLVDGLGMLVSQGAIAINLRSGRNPRTNLMRRALESIFDLCPTRFSVANEHIR